MPFDAELKQQAEYAGEKLALSPRLLASWWVSENGWTWPATNNVGNISYLGEGVPDTGVFAGVVEVNPNKTVTYGNATEGVNAFILLLSAPKGPNKALTLDINDLHACGEDVHQMTVVIGQSNWASSHYDPNGDGPGSLIWDVYNSAKMAEAFATVAQPQPPAADPQPSNVVPMPTRSTRPKHATYTVVAGDTLSKVALQYQTTVKALQVYNHIANPDIIEVGQALEIPLTYRVRPGDTVSKIAAAYGDSVEEVAAANNINPSYIQAGWTLRV